MPGGVELNGADNELSDPQNGEDWYMNRHKNSRRVSLAMDMDQEATSDTLQRHKRFSFSKDDDSVNTTVLVRQLSLSKESTQLTMAESILELKR